MLQEIIDSVTDWPVIIQGIVGSALFWVIARGIKWGWDKANQGFGRYKKSTRLHRNIKEWVYRKYTNQNGLLYFSQGYFITFYETLNNMVKGIMFLCMGFLFETINSIFPVIGIMGGLYYFLEAHYWLNPPSEWEKGSGLENLKKVAELEKKFYGKIDDDTKERIEKIMSSSKDISKLGLEELKKIAELEEHIFGSIPEDTKKLIEEYTSSEDPPISKK